MKKISVVSLLAFVLFPGSPAFTQPRNPVKAAVNLANVERVVADAVTQNVKEASIQEALINAWVPAHFVSSEKVTLQAVVVPTQYTPVTASLLNQIPPSANENHMRALASRFILGGYGEHGYGKAFYEDASELARDLDRSYQGNAEIRVGPDGREVKLYALPVDGILYKPVGYSTPKVLNSQDYFVIYDVKAQTGKIADNIPLMYNLFQKPAYPTLWEALVGTKAHGVCVASEKNPFVFSNLINLYDTVVLDYLYQIRIQQRLRAGQAADWETVLKEDGTLVWEEFTKPSDFAQVYRQFVTYRPARNGMGTVKIMELPVAQVSWTDGGLTRTYNRGEYMLVASEQDGVRLLPRTQVQAMYGNIDTQAGQLAFQEPGTPAPSPLSEYDEIWEAMGVSKEFGDMGTLCDAILMVHLYKNAIAHLQEEYKEQIQMSPLVKGLRTLVYDQLNRSDELLIYLNTLPKVRHAETKIKAYVVELPVDGLMWIEPNGITHLYHPHTHVMLFFEMGGVGIFPRANVENPDLFTPLP